MTCVRRTFAFVNLPRGRHDRTVINSVSIVETLSKPFGQYFDLRTILFIFSFSLVNRFRCPKGWRRLGGSCYYLSNLTSTSVEANLTCNFLHSNQSNLMQIRNTVELFYAAHVLTKNNLSSLMIDIDMNLLKGTTPLSSSSSLSLA